jgi:hypothetical protein
MAILLTKLDLGDVVGGRVMRDAVENLSISADEKSWTLEKIALRRSLATPEAVREPK